MKGGVEMKGMKVFVTVILLALSLFTALLLESRMGAGAAGELVVILIGTIITAGILFGVWIEEPWAYPLALLFFAASLANLLWIFSSTQIFLTFAFGILVNVAGLVMCLVSFEKAIPAPELETYSAGPPRKSATPKKKKKGR